MKTSEYIVETLVKNGIDTFFVVTGGSIVPFINSVSKYNYYCFQHEQSAAMAAEGYFRASGKIACVCVTSGPGVQNIMNGLCGCWYDSIPALFITGQVNTEEDLKNLSCKPRQAGFQEMPVKQCFEHFTVYTDQIRHINEVFKVVKNAITALKTPRYGPVLIDLPVNIQMSNIEEHNYYIYKNITHNTCSVDITEYMNNSKRPLVIFGNGVKLSGSKDAALNFVRKFRLPFTVSWGAFDICETDEPLRVGSHGVYGDRVSNYTVQNADLLIILGSRLDTKQTGGNLKLFSRFSKKIMVDIDENEMNKLSEKGVDIHLKINMDLKYFFDNVTCGIIPNIDSWNEKIKDWKIKYGNEFTKEGDSVVYDYLENLFSNNIKDNSIIVPDTGGNLVWTMQTAKINSTQQLFTNFGNSSMGFALPCALGAAIATGKIVYCIIGDGGIQMNIQELLTVSKYKLPIKIIILNNSSYGIIKQFQDSYFSSKYTATSKKDVFGDTVDFSSIAKCYGVHDLLDVPIPESQKIYPKVEFGNSLENMTPYISFEDDMIVDVPPKKSLGWV